MLYLAIIDIIEEIKNSALSYGIAFASAEEIDSLNIYEATKLAMKRALAQISCPYQMILTDAMPFKDLPVPVIPVIKGDATALNIAAASILAKVTRDRLCIELDRAYPQYGIAQHKGYGTKAHMDALRTYGPSPIHRKKFIRFLDDPT